MARRNPIDVPLKLFTVPVHFQGGAQSLAQAEGNNAAWMCCCGRGIPLVGRCYYQFGDTCFTVCPECSRKYRVVGMRRAGAGNKTVRVEEE